MNAPRLANIARTALVPRRGFGSTTPGLPQVRVPLGVSVLFHESYKPISVFSALNSVIMTTFSLFQTRFKVSGKSIKKHYVIVLFFLHHPGKISPRIGHLLRCVDLPGLGAVPHEGIQGPGLSP